MIRRSPPPGPTAIRRRVPRRALAALLLLPLAACTGRDTDADDRAAAPAAEVAGSVERLAGTPAGGLRDWVAEIRAGIAGLGERAQRDAPGAEKVAVDLYVGRQEWLERYWGTYGLIAQSRAPVLGQSVMDAEARFHELLMILAGSDTPDPASVGAAVTALDEQLETVLAEADRANVPLAPPSGPDGGTAAADSGARR